MNPTLPLPIDLAAVIFGLRAFLFRWHGRGVLTEALMVLLHRRVGVILARFERMLARYRAGGTMVRGPRAAAGPVEEKAARAVGVSIWPLGSGWLRAAVQPNGHHLGPIQAQMDALLRTPEMVAFLIAAPQAGRLIRPVCRMLGLDTALLRPRPEGEVVSVAKKTKPVRVRPAPETWRIPLPRGVISAIRRQKREGVFRKDEDT